jgi:hypothetical protein
MTVQGWLKLVKRIDDLNRNDHFAVTDPIRPKDPLERLMVGWTGWSNFKINRMTYWALKVFAKKLLYRLRENQVIAKTKTDPTKVTDMLHSMDMEFNLYCKDRYNQYELIFFF